MVDISLLCWIYFLHVPKKTGEMPATNAACRNRPPWPDIVAVGPGANGHTFWGFITTVDVIVTLYILAYLPYQLVGQISSINSISTPSTWNLLLDFRTVIDGYGINFEITSCDCMHLNGISSRIQWVMFSTNCPFPLINKIAYDTWPTSTFLMYI